MKRKIAIFAVLISLVIINYTIWGRVNNPLELKPWTKTTMGITFDPMRKEDTQTSNTFPSVEEIDRDLSLLANKVFAVRTYSTRLGLEKVPELVGKYNLNVTLGAWIGSDLERNKKEIDTLINIALPENPKIVRLIVGNESLLRTEVTQQELINYIQEVKTRRDAAFEQYNKGKKDKEKKKPFPVSTSETWDIWLKRDEAGNLINQALADSVDFIAVHILPYWEGIDSKDAVDQISQIAQELSALMLGAQQ